MSRNETKVTGIFDTGHRRHFCGRVPEGGAEVVDFAEIERRTRFANYSYCLLQLEADCSRLVGERYMGNLFPVQPATAALRDFVKGTDTLREYLKNLKAKNLLDLLDKVEPLAKRLNLRLNDLTFIPKENSSEHDYTLRKIEVLLCELRGALKQLFPQEGVTLPEPAYHF